MPLWISKRGCLLGSSILQKLGGSEYCYAPLHVCVKNYVQSENFGCQKKLTFLGSLKRWSDALGFEKIA